MPISLSFSRDARAPFARCAITRSVGFCLLLAAAMLPFQAEGRAKPTICPDLTPAVVVEAGVASDAEAACLGASRAYAFLAERGITAEQPVHIQVVNEIDALNGAPVAGIFNRRTKMVKVLSRAAFEGDAVNATMLTLKMDADLHASVFAHEVAHAVVDQHLAGREVTTAAQEYIAYTVQLSTLPTAVRDRVLAKFPGVGFTAPEQINTLILAMNPHRFATNAYKHFHRKQHGAEALDEILSMSEPMIDLLD